MISNPSCVILVIHRERGIKMQTVYEVSLKGWHEKYYFAKLEVAKKVEPNPTKIERKQ